MPGPVLPPDLRAPVSLGVRELRTHLADRAGLTQLASLAQVRDEVRAALTPGAPQRDARPVAPKTAANMLELLGSLPVELTTHADAPLLEPPALSTRQLAAATSAAAQVLLLGAEALLSGAPTPDTTADSIVHAALGSDRLAAALRRAVVDPKLPVLPKPGPGAPEAGGPSLARLTELARAGALREFLDALRRGGLAARGERDWLAGIITWGRVTSLVPSGACAGQVVRIDFAGFGPAAPADGDILVALPVGLGSFRHLSLRQTNPALFQPGGWSDTGSVEVTLPAEIACGPVGFLAVPPGSGSAGGSSVGDLTGSAGALAEVLGPLLGQRVVAVAAAVEAGRFGSLPGAAAQADGANQLIAGLPRILGFRVVEQGWVHPRGTVTLEWSTANADTVEIVAVEVPGSEHPHELPPVTGPLAAHGRVTLGVPCTRRWEGQYVLRVTNAAPCQPQPVEQAVPIVSGWSHYQVGVAKVDITPREPGLGLAGFAYAGQVTGSPVEVHSALQARAVVISEHTGPGGAVLGLVVADLWTCTQRLKQEVLDRLRAQGLPFDEANLLIAGTHTHAAPGGYSDYALYNFSVGATGGRNRAVLDRYAAGIASAVQSAYLSRGPGRVLVHQGDLAGCGDNRSFPAFRGNREFLDGTFADPSQWIDRQMLLLALHADVDNRGRSRPLGAVNWFGIHPTSLGMYNAMISGDSKGRAAELMEAGLGGGFVAAFGNGNAGDVSGNVTLDAAGRPTGHVPEGGAVREPVTLRGGLLGLPRTRDPRQDGDLARLEALATAQADHARMLFDAATTEVSGPLRARHQWVDLSQVRLPDGGRTWPAAVGISFGAGSSEDSYAVASMGPIDLDAGIPEGMTHVQMAAGAVLASSTLALTAPGLLGALAAGAPLSPAAVVGLVPAMQAALTLLAASPEARGFVFGGIGALAFPGKLQDQAPPGTQWLLPGPLSLPMDYVAGHAQKPIMFPVGLAWLLPKPGSTQQVGTGPCPLVPHVLPVQLLRIGQVAIAGVPAEFTATAGRRIKGVLGRVLGSSASHLAVSNYTNGYSGYVTTGEEYEAQHYEGASTLYGPNTLAAYELIVEGLATAVERDLPVDAVSRVPASPPFLVPGIFEHP
ncbi:MAG TPA: neutral/alkaline non-lysosomal ceramidase N-terminal domain-containing protein [Candidatus Nanopelagicales bacterium]